jgi:hypothetical protein
MVMQDLLECSETRTHLRQRLGWHGQWCSKPAQAVSNPEQYGGDGRDRSESHHVLKDWIPYLTKRHQSHCHRCSAAKDTPHQPGDHLKRNDHPSTRFETEANAVSLYMEKTSISVGKVFDLVPREFTCLRAR